jgi:hypothetical protein
MGCFFVRCRLFLGIVRLVEEKSIRIIVTLQDIEAKVPGFPDRSFMIRNGRTHEFVAVFGLYVYHNRCDNHPDLHCWYGLKIHVAKPEKQSGVNLGAMVTPLATRLRQISNSEGRISKAEWMQSD